MKRLYVETLFIVVLMTVGVFTAAACTSYVRDACGWVVGWVFMVLAAMMIGALHLRAVVWRCDADARRRGGFDD